VIAIATLLSTPVQAGEEIGWRGYALPALATRFGLGPVSILVGLAWGIWHLPFFFLPGAAFGNSIWPISARNGSLDHPLSSRSVVGLLRILRSINKLNKNRRPAELEEVAF
jgi:membrane protease YdiL (CAAX protease family)